MSKTKIIVTLPITQDQLEAALLRWELQHRAGLTRTHTETAELPAEQVAAESAATLWGHLLALPETRSELEMQAAESELHAAYRAMEKAHSIREQGSASGVASPPGIEPGSAP